MLNLAVGPVMMDEEILRIGAEQIPYFRTGEFSNLMKENERLLIKCAYAEAESRVIFLTASGTAAMEATVINLFTEKDKVLIVSGGGFGKRFREICDIHSIPSEEIHIESGQALTAEVLQAYNNRGFTGFLVNVHETTTGVL